MRDLADRDPEDLARRALAAGPTRAPSTLHRAIATDVARTPQARGLLARLRDPMPLPGARLPFVAVAAPLGIAVISLAVAGAALLVALGRPGLPEATPALPSTAVPTPATPTVPTPGPSDGTPTPPASADAGPVALDTAELWLIGGFPPSQRPLAVDMDAAGGPSLSRPCERPGILASTELCSGMADALAWSPDGSSLAFVRVTVPGVGEDVRGLYVFRPADRSTTRLAGCDVVACATDRLHRVWWTDNGTAVAVGAATTAGAEPAPGLAVVDVALGRVRRSIEPPPAAVAMVPSPDGNRLAWTDGAAVYAGDPDGSDPVRLFTGVAGWVAWSPDGSRLSFGHVRERGAGAPGTDYAWEVHVVRADGSGDTVRYERPGCCAGGGIATEATWSPDGTRLGWVGLRDLVIIPVPGGEAQVVATGLPPSLAAPAWRALP